SSSMAARLPADLPQRLSMPPMPCRHSFALERSPGKRFRHVYERSTTEDTISSTPCAPVPPVADAMTKRGGSLLERAALVGVVAGRARRLDAERSLDELAGLAEAAGATVVLRVLQERPKPDPSTYLGSGKVATLAASSADTDVDVVIFDNELTPAQLRQIEEEVGRKILDRTQLILDSFARRARTREGKLQVELAQLKYLLPRLVGAGTALSRLGGGIGTRGPGETKLETDRRRIRTR